jgi:hypothetical protein
MFFHFQLTPIAEIKPWGKKDEPSLHWFGLSDGRYWIQIGETEVFRYSKTVLAAYPPQDPALATHSLDPYLDYYVARLWEDILEIVPDILDPLPAPLVQRMEPIDTWLQWCQKAHIWQEDPQEICSEEALDARRSTLVSGSLQCFCSSSGQIEIDTFALFHAQLYKVSVQILFGE